MGRRAKTLSIVTALLAASGQAPARAEPPPTETPAIDAYRESLPSTRGPVVSGEPRSAVSTPGEKARHSLPAATERALRRQGATGDLLERLATEPTLGGTTSRPPAGTDGLGRSRAAVERSQGPVSATASAARDIVEGDAGEPRRLYVLVALLGTIAAVAVGVALRSR